MLRRRGVPHLFVAVAVIAASFAVSGTAGAQTPQGSGVPVSSGPAPSLPPMPPLPEIPQLVPLAVQRGQAAAATSTTLPVLGGDGSTSTSLPGVDGSPSTSLPSDAAVSGGEDSEDPLSAASRFSSTLTDMGVPGFDTDGTLAARPLGGIDSMGRLTERYTTLGGTLTAFYAAQTGAPLPSFVASNSDTLAAALGTTPTKASSVTSLSEQIAAAGAAPLSGASDFSSYASRLASRSDSVDSQVALAGLAWAQEMSKFRSGSGQLTPEALAFAGVLSSSTTSMIGQFPDVYAQVRSSGVADASTQQAWRTSMLSAMSASNRDLSALVPNKCFASMMTAMSSGSATAANRSGAGCGGSCLATGLYLNRQLSALFSPASTSTLANRSDSLMPPAEWTSLPGWQRQIIQQQNPSLATSAAASAPSTSGCSGSSAATSSAASVTLPKVFSALQR